MRGRSLRDAHPDIPHSEFRIPHFVHRFANAKLSVSSSAAMLTDFTTTSGGTASWTGAKLRIALTPDCTSSSTTCCAASAGVTTDRKSTRLNSSHSQISYAVFCLKKKKQEPPKKTGAASWLDGRID